MGRKFGWDEGNQILDVIRKIGNRLQGHDDKIVALEAANKRLEQRIKSLEQALDNELPLY